MDVSMCNIIDKYFSKKTISNKDNCGKREFYWKSVLSRMFFKVLWWVHSRYCHKESLISSYLRVTIKENKRANIRIRCNCILLFQYTCLTKCSYQNLCLKVDCKVWDNFLATEIPFKMMKNAFYFTLNTLFVLKIFHVLSWRFGKVEKQLH